MIAPFGAFLRFEEGANLNSILDGVFDHIENAGFDEDQWDWMAWTSSVTLYMIFSAPLGVRAALLGVEGVRVAPLGVVAERLSDNRNQWYEPKTGDRPAAEIAASKLAQWQEEFLAEKQSGEVAATSEGDEDVVVNMKARRERINKVRNPEAPSEDVLKEFLNVGDALDSDGNKFTFVKL